MKFEVSVDDVIDGVDVVITRIDGDERYSTKKEIRSEEDYSVIRDHIGRLIFHIFTPSSKVLKKGFWQIEQDKNKK